LSAEACFPTLRLYFTAASAALTLEGVTLPGVLYRIEGGRGYDNVGVMWSPGVFTLQLTADHPAVLTASTEPWDRMMSLAPQASLEAELKRREQLLAAAMPAAREGLGGELVLAADQFIIAPAGRVGMRREPRRPAARR